LRPLFCTMDVNIQSSSGSAGDDFFLDPLLARAVQVSMFVQLDQDTYDKQIAKNHQFIIDGSFKRGPDGRQDLNAPCKAALARGEFDLFSALADDQRAQSPKCTPLSLAGKPFRDPVAGFTFPERSGQDQFYVARLKCEDEFGTPIPKCQPVL